MHFNTNTSIANCRDAINRERHQQPNKHKAQTNPVTRHELESIWRHVNPALEASKTQACSLRPARKHSKQSERSMVKAIPRYCSCTIRDKTDSTLFNKAEHSRPRAMTSRQR